MGLVTKDENHGICAETIHTVTKENSNTTLATGQQVTVNNGVSEAFLQQQIDRIETLGEELSVTQFAIKNFFRILEEQHIPAYDWDFKLREIAQHYLVLKSQATQVYQSDNAAINALVKQADEAIEAVDFDQAESLLDQAQALFQRDKVKQELLSYAEILAKKAALAHTQIKYLKAAQLYEQAAEQLMPFKDECSKDLSFYLDQSGCAFENAGDYPKASGLLEQALNIREQGSVNEIDLAASLNNLAALYYSMGEYEQALPLYERSLAIREKVLGNGHPDVATSLNNLALLYKSMGEYEQALPLYKRSLAINEKALGNDHPDVATSLNNLALLYSSMGEYEQALPLSQRAVAIALKKLGEGHPSTKLYKETLAIIQAQLNLIASANYSTLVQYKRLIL